MSDTQEDLERQQLLLGRELVARWTGLLKALSPYDWRHSAVRAAAERVLGVVRELGDGSPIELAIRQDLIYLDGARLKEGGARATAFQRLIGLLRSARIKSFVTDPNTDPRDLQVFGHLLLGVRERGVTPEEMLRELKVQSADSLEVAIDAAGEEEGRDAPRGPSATEARLHLLDRRSQGGLPRDAREGPHELATCEEGRAADDGVGGAGLRLRPQPHERQELRRVHLQPQCQRRRAGHRSGPRHRAPAQGALRRRTGRDAPRSGQALRLEGDLSTSLAPSHPTNAR